MRKALTLQSEAVHFKIVPHTPLQIGEGKVLKKGFEMHPSEAYFH